MSQRWSSVVLQRTKQWIGVDLVSWSRQITGAIVSTYVVTQGRYRAIDIGAYVIVQDRVSYFQSTAGRNAATNDSRVVADRAIRDGPTAIDPPAVEARMVIA